MARCYASALVFSAVFMLVLDYLYLTQIGSYAFSPMIQKIQGYPLTVNKTYALITYLVMLVGLLTLSIYHVKEDNLIKDSLFYGGLLGLVVYGVFDFTNLAIFKNYDLNNALLDTVWGTFLMATTTLVGAWASYKQKWFVK